MVHTGKPSRGCGVCRRRRIKCDEKSPQCSYCIKTNQDCPGYKDAFDLAWRDQTFVAKKSVERRTRALSNKGTKSLAVNNLPSENNSLILESEQYPDGLLANIVPILTSQPTESASTYAVGFFFSTYARPPFLDEERGGFLEYVAPLFSVAGYRSTLYYSTLAIASCMFTAWLSRNPDNALSRTYYSQALCAMKNQIMSPKDCTNDAILTSVLLLQMYETLLSNFKMTTPPRTHVEGALSIIRYRGLQNFGGNTSKGLLAEIRAQLIEQSFAVLSPLADDIGDWSRLLKAPELPLAVHFDTINIDLANLVASASDLILNHKTQQNIQQNSTITNLIQQFYILETRFAGWFSGLPPHWLPVIVLGSCCIPHSVEIAGLYQKHCHIYPSIPVSTTWIKYYISLIRTHMMIISLFHCLSSVIPLHKAQLENSLHVETREDVQAQVTKSLDQIQSLADDICASVPFRLGDRREGSRIGDTSVQYPHLPGQGISEAHYRMAPALGAFGLLGPLKVLLYLEANCVGFAGLRDGQVQWISGQVERISKLYNLSRYESNDFMDIQS